LTNTLVTVCLLVLLQNTSFRSQDVSFKLKVEMSFLVDGASKKWLASVTVYSPF